MSFKQPILVMSVHPDDETLGCGGTILRHRKEGSDVYWLIITNISEKNGWTTEASSQRSQEIKSVALSYGFKKIFNLDFPPKNLDLIPLDKLIENVTEVVKSTKPEIIYTINRSDVHSDHKISFQAILSSTKNFRCPSIKKILMYECLSETEFAPSLSENAFVPNVFVDISDYLDEKIRIMSLFQSEVMPDYLPRSFNTIKMLAAYRGSRIGVKYAEAFQLLFEKI